MILKSTLNKRQSKIINILKNSKQPISSKALAEDIGCSTKTIQLEVKNINSIMDNIKIESSRGVGYNLVGDISSIKNIKDESIRDDLIELATYLKK